MLYPPHLSLDEYCADTGTINRFQNFKVGDFVLSFDSKDGTEGSDMEVLKFFNVLTVQNSRTYIHRVEKGQQQLCRPLSWWACECYASSGLFLSLPSAWLALLVRACISASSDPLHEMVLPRYFKHSTLQVRCHLW